MTVTKSNTFHDTFIAETDFKRFFLQGHAYNLATKLHVKGTQRLDTFKRRMRNLTAYQSIIEPDDL